MGSPQDQDYGASSFGSPNYGDLNEVADYTFSAPFTVGNTMVFASDSTNEPGFLAMVQDWVDNPSHNNGLEIRAPGLEITSQSFIGWWTHDGDDMNPGSTGPKLIITY